MIELPNPDMIRAARDAVELTQAEAAELVHLGRAVRWSEYERGAQTIDAARWELFLIKTGQHPLLAPAIALIVTESLCPGVKIE